MRCESPAATSPNSFTIAPSPSMSDSRPTFERPSPAKTFRLRSSLSRAERRVVERGAGQSFEDDARRDRVRLELELDARQMVERRGERTGRKAAQREAPPLFLLAARPGLRGEPLERVESRLAEPVRLAPPETVLLDRFAVEQQRDLGERRRASQWHPASGA